MFSIVIILSMILFGGSIAFLGDRVGMKVGKKRLSLFGLRPKYTSMIITVFTGFCIAGITLLFLTLMSEYVRTAIFELNTIKAKVVSLTREVAKKQQQYLKLRQQLKEVTAQQEMAVSSLNRKKIELNLAQDRLTNLTKIKNDLEMQNTNLIQQETRLNQQIQNLEGWLKSLDERNKTIVDQPMIFYVGEILVSKVVEPGNSTDSIFEKIIKPSLQEADEVAYKRGARIPGKNSALRAIPQQIDQVCNQLAALKKKAVLRVVIDKNSLAGEPATVNLAIFPDQLIFRAGEVIEATEVSAATSESELRDKLISLLLLANNKALEKGIITDGPNLKDLIPVSEVVQVIMRIKEQKEGLFKVELLAADNIYRVDPFRVKYNIVLLTPMQTARPDYHPGS
jgi:uncharacterized protein (DUF3084 family)